MNKKVVTPILIAGFAVCLTGCGATKKELADPKKSQYVKSVHSLATVEKGDMESSFSLTLKGADYEKIDYSVNISDINIGLETGELSFDGCFVTLGQHVDKGDLLLSYTDKKLDKEIKGYTDSIRDNDALIEHYEELMDIDPSKDYKEDIEALEDKNDVLYLYKAEAEKKRDNYRIYAKEEGTISYIYDDMVENQGLIWEAGERFNVISESTGSSIFSTSTEENYEFKVGDVFEATSSLNKYSLTVTEVEKVGGTTKITFAPTDEDVSIQPGATLTLKINRPVMKDVVYVNAKAIKYTEAEAPFVYTIDEDGFRHAVLVELGERIDSNVIILSGLDGGEEVSID
ncbi:MAG: hypothetical protein IJ703_11240 [Eubacterium sp.]|nr:hypothetical protein [Eubacterium sp.]